MDTIYTAIQYFRGSLLKPLISFWQSGENLIIPSLCLHLQADPIPNDYALEDLLADDPRLLRLTGAAVVFLPLLRFLAPGAKADRAKSF